MDRLKELLEEIGVIVREDNAKRRERDKNGENFNVFKVLDLQRDEERLHSAFIAELLNPKGAHGMKDTFLKLFKDIFIDYDKDCEKWDFDTKNAIVDTEHTFENGRIDILIESPKERKGIIIENKIDACDQEEQLLRYDRFAKSRYHSTENYQLIYLTPEGDEASEKSTKNNKELYNRYISASYKEDILQWINTCIKRCSLPPIQEILIQYKNNSKDIFNMMDEKDTDELVKIAVSNNNVAATLAVIKNQKNIQKAIIENFIKQMQKRMQKHNGLVCTTQGDLPNLEDQSGLLFYYPKSHWALYIGAFQKHLQSYSTVYGIIQRNGGKKIRITQKKLKEIRPVWNFQDSDYPLGFFSFYRDKKTRKWYNWSDWKVSEDMASGEFANWIEESIFPEVFEGKNTLGKKNLLKYIERITKEE